MKKTKKIQSLVKMVQSPPESSDYLKTLGEALLKKDLKNENLRVLLLENSSHNKKVLDLINSPLFQFEQEVKSAYQAFLYIGIFDFYQLALLSEIFEIFRSYDTEKDKFDSKGFWKHSLACGIASREIAKHIVYNELQSAFVAGVLHDIGKMCWKKYFNRYLKIIVDSVRSEDILMIEAEKRSLDITHCELGHWFLETLGAYSGWNQVVLYHHNPEAFVDKDPLVPIVHVADVLVRALCIGNPGDDKIPTLNPLAFERCQLTAGHLEFVLHRIWLEVESLELLLDSIL